MDVPWRRHQTSYSHLRASFSPTNHRFVADILAVNDLLVNEPWSDSPRQYGILGRSCWCCTLFARTGASSEKQFSFLSWHINLFQRSLHFLLLLKHSSAAISVLSYRHLETGHTRTDFTHFTHCSTWCVYKRPVFRNLTPWAVPLDNLRFPQLINKFSPPYGTRRFITAYTTAHHFTLSSVRWFQPTRPRLDTL
jgi:hypothetical protein